MEANEHNLLDISGLTGKAKTERLFELLRSYPTHYSYSERLHSLAARTGITPKLLLQTARRNGFEAQLATIVAAQQEREEYAARLEATAPLAVDIPVTRIAANVKGLVWTLLTASRRFVDTACLSLQFYSDKIATKVSEVGGMANLTEADMKQVGAWQSQLNYYAKQLQPYLQPSAIATLLNSIDFTNRLPQNDEEVNSTAFTIHALQKRMLELGMGSAFDNPQKAIEGFTSEPLPILDGWTNAETSTPLSFETPPTADESAPKVTF